MGTILFQAKQVFPDGIKMESGNIPEGRSKVFFLAPEAEFYLTNNSEMEIETRGANKSEITVLFNGETPTQPIDTEGDLYAFVGELEGGWCNARFTPSVGNIPAMKR